MKTIITNGIAAAVCAIAIPALAWAAPDHMLVHVKSTDNPHSIEISDQTRITFDNTTMNISHPSGNLSMEIANIYRMEFDLQTTSTDDIETSLDSGITFKVTGHHIEAVSATGARINMDVYDSTGRHISSISGEGMVETDFFDYRQGVYIIVCGNKTIKYLNR